MECHGHFGRNDLALDFIFWTSTRAAFSLVLAVLQNFTAPEGFAVTQEREKHYPVYL
jgi:hypothetical protein